MVQLTGIESVAFPSVEKLTETQLQKLTEELRMLIESYNYIINLPQRLPASIAYQKLTGNWNVEIPIITAGLSALGWMFCDDDPETCGMHEWCDWLFCEVDPATFPVYNGIYDDDGNKIDILSIPTPDLCLTCAKFLIAILYSTFQQVLACCNLCQVFDNGRIYFLPCCFKAIN
jgi:hypothetical protein